MDFPSTRTRQILSRFPGHLELERPGKRITWTVNALSEPLDLLSAASGQVRRDHRLSSATSPRDLILQSGLHAWTDDDFQLVLDLLAQLRAHASILLDDSESAELRTLSRNAIAKLLGRPHLQGELAPEIDIRNFERSLGQQLQSVCQWPAPREWMRLQLATLIRIHAHGNGTISALLQSAASYFGYLPGPVYAMEMVGWYRCEATQPAPLLPDSENGIEASHVSITPQNIFLEENPLVPKTRPLQPRKYAEHFSIDRHGLDHVSTEIQIRGVGLRTREPMLVSLSERRGVYWVGYVPDKETLRFHPDGRVRLGDSDVSRYAYAFEGALFADENASGELDCSFADESAAEEEVELGSRFARSMPYPDAFAQEPILPHPPGAVPSLTLFVGTTRFIPFIGVPHFGSQDSDGDDVAALASYHAGRWDRSAFDHHKEPGPCMDIGFAWREHEAFSVVIWLPESWIVREEDPDSPRRTALLEHQLHRHRAAGVSVRVRYASDHWLLPDGIIRDLTSEDPIGTEILGTRIHD